VVSVDFSDATESFVEHLDHSVAGEEDSGTVGGASATVDRSLGGLPGQQEFAGASIPQAKASIGAG
jgi:hypothetical protein